MKRWAYSSKTINSGQSRGSLDSWDYGEHPRNNYHPTIITSADTSKIDPLDIAKAHIEISKQILGYLGIGRSE